MESKRGDAHVLLTVASGTFLAMDTQTIAVATDSKYAGIKDLIEAGRREPNATAASVASATGTGLLLLFLIERETGAKFRFVMKRMHESAAWREA